MGFLAFPGYLHLYVWKLLWVLTNFIRAKGQLNSDAVSNYKHISYSSVTVVFCLYNGYYNCAMVSLLSLLPHLFLFKCIGKAVLPDCGLFCVTSFLF